MKMLSCIAVLLLWMGGCRAQPLVTIDPRALDCIPVVVLAFPGTGIATGLVLDDGTVLTCSHALPPEAQDGSVQVHGVLYNYHVVGRGAPEGVESWRVNQPPASLDDWAVISLNRPMNAASVVGCAVPCVLVFEPPRIGETVYLVGYTAEMRSAPGETWFVRYWIPLVVVPAPKGFPATLASSVVWLQTTSRKSASPDPSVQPSQSRPLHELRLGFSGSPILRLGYDSAGEARFEVCAILHSKSDGRTDHGSAIVPTYPAGHLRSDEVASELVTPSREQ